MSEELDDSAFCPVCFECYSESGVAVPRLLPCTHTLCHACVDKFIKNSTLVCPQDRKAHPALSGVLSFPQNKYVLKMMTQGKVSDERKTFLKSQASLLIKQLSLRKGQLIATKQKVNGHRMELVQKLKQAQDELDKEFDGEIKVIDENIEKLNEICQETSSDLLGGKTAIERLQKEAKERVQEKYKFYDLMEISRNMEPPEEMDIKYYEKEETRIEGINVQYAMIGRHCVW